MAATRAADGTLELGDLELELGGMIPSARLGYRTHGTLSPHRDNAVLFPHMYSASPASLDPWIEGGHALDPERWFVICPGQLGGGLSSSPSNDPRRRFPGADDRRRRHRSASPGHRPLRHRAPRARASASRWADSRPTSGRSDSRTWSSGWRCSPGSPGRRRPTTCWSAASADALAAGLIQHAHFWAATGLSPEVFRQEAWREAGFDVGGGPRHAPVRGRLHGV